MISGFVLHVRVNMTTMIVIPLKGSEGNSESMLLFLFPRNGIFSLPLKGSEGNSESMLLFLFPRNRIPRCFLFRGRVRNGIPRFFVPQNSRNSVRNNRLLQNYFFVGNSQPYLGPVSPYVLQ
jgi:hypothetical protein